MNTNFSQHHTESLRSRFGLRVGARLSAGTHELPHDVRERLRAARERALASAPVPQLDAAAAAEHRQRLRDLAARLRRGG